MPPRAARRAPVIRTPKTPSPRPATAARAVPETRGATRGTRPIDQVRQGFSNLQAPTGYQHVLMGEMVAAFIIIGIRAIADYVPASDLHSPGTETPKKGASPIVLITATLGVFFVLSFLATRGGWTARTGAAFGLLMIIALMINSEGELIQVATWVENIGANNQSQPAQQQPSPTISSGGSASNSAPKSVPTSGPGSASDPLQ